MNARKETVSPHNQVKQLRNKTFSSSKSNSKKPNKSREKKNNVILNSKPLKKEISTKKDANKSKFLLILIKLIY